MGEVITNIAKVSPDEWNTLDEFSSFNISLASLNTRIVLVREHTIFKRKEPKKRTSWNVFSNNRYQGIFLLKTKCKTLAGKSCLAGQPTPFYISLCLLHHWNVQTASTLMATQVLRLRHPIFGTLCRSISESQVLSLLSRRAWKHNSFQNKCPSASRMLSTFYCFVVIGFVLAFCSHIMHVMCSVRLQFKTLYFI